MRRLGIDTGGTFTDAVLESGAILKIPSVPLDPAIAIREAARALAPDGPLHLLHGTTVATNAVLEGRLAPVGVIVNRGFRDLLEIRRQSRPELYALEPRRAALPTRRELSAEVAGRMTADGIECEAFDTRACRDAGLRLRRAGAEAFAVVLLHSYRNPAHERKALTTLRSLGLPITLSSKLDPEFREVERGVTAVLNASLRPKVEAYLKRLAKALGPRVRISVLMSDGGLIAPAAAAIEPARLLMSGPAGGVAGARVYADAVGLARTLTLDMGGTSSDVACIEGELPRSPSLTIAGHVVRLPSLEIHTVGAGGGSIARKDAGGALKVGPESAGALPGPAAYGHGGPLTVTDAHLLLGRIAPQFFAAGEDALDPGKSEMAARKLARSLSMTTTALLRGVLKLSNHAMARALSFISLEKGRDVRSAGLLVFGGAGGLHGVALARLMKIGTVLVPPEPGVLAARGLLWTPPARTAVRTVLARGCPPATTRRRLAAPLREEVQQALREDGGPIRFTTWLDLRYVGQSFEVEVEDGPDVLEKFHARHAVRFGFADRAREVELVALRVRGEVAVEQPKLPVLRPRKSGRLVPLSSMKATFNSEFAPVFHRSDFRAGDEISGPAILADATSTTFVEGGATAHVHRTGTLMISAGGRG